MVLPCRRACTNKTRSIQLSHVYDIVISISQSHQTLLRRHVMLVAKRNFRLPMLIVTSRSPGDAVPEMATIFAFKWCRNILDATNPVYNKAANFPPRTEIKLIRITEHAKDRTHDDLYFCHAYELKYKLTCICLRRQFCRKSHGHPERRLIPIRCTSSLLHTGLCFVVCRHQRL